MMDEQGPGSNADALSLRKEGKENAHAHDERRAMTTTDPPQLKKHNLGKIISVVCKMYIFLYPSIFYRIPLKKQNNSVFNVKARCKCIKI